VRLEVHGPHAATGKVCCTNLEKGLGKVQLVAFLTWADPAQLLIPVRVNTVHLRCVVLVRALLLHLTCLPNS
jgi:hypothetical protein